MPPERNMNEQHDWVPSTLGHGTKMCSRCKMTLEEAAALDELSECSIKLQEL